MNISCGKGILQNKYNLIVINLKFVFLVDFNAYEFFIVFFHLNFNCFSISNAVNTYSMHLFIYLICMH